MNMTGFLNSVEAHSGLLSLVSLFMAILAALFPPSMWRRIVGSVLVGIAGIFFLPYDAANVKTWAGKAMILVFVFNGAFWWTVEHVRRWRTKRTAIPLQPSGTLTLEATAESVSRIFAAESSDAKLSVHLSTSAGTFTITKQPGK